MVFWLRGIDYSGSVVKKKSEIFIMDDMADKLRFIFRCQNARVDGSEQQNIPTNSNREISV